MLHEPKAKRVDKPKQSEQTAEKYEFFVNGIDGSLNRRKMKANEQKGERETYTCPIGNELKWVQKLSIILKSMRKIYHNFKLQPGIRSALLTVIWPYYLWLQFNLLIQMDL